VAPALAAHRPSQPAPNAIAGITSAGVKRLIQTVRRLIQTHKTQLSRTLRRVKRLIQTGLRRAPPPPLPPPLPQKKPSPHPSKKITPLPLLLPHRHVRPSAARACRWVGYCRMSGRSGAAMSGRTCLTVSSKPKPSSSTTIGGRCPAPRRARPTGWQPGETGCGDPWRCAGSNRRGPGRRLAG